MGREPAVRIIALAATKGGVGKTTLTAALAVRAAADRKRVALIDADAQQSLSFWHELRGSPDNPRWFDLPCTAEAVGLIAAEGFDWVFVDTPPALMDQIAEAVHIADFVLIPVRPSAIDIDAVQAMVEICQEQGKPFAFVLNQVEPGWKLTTTTAEVLSDFGSVLSAQVAYRKPYISAMTGGKTGPETGGIAGKTCAEEIDALWAALKRAASKAIRERA